MATESESTLPSEVLAYYRKGGEAHSLLTGTGQLEFTRTQEIIDRHLPEPPAIIYDIGGGPGLYARWLAQRGYEVHLVDATPLHVEQAQTLSRLQPEHPITSLTVGDARHVTRDDGSVDVVLLLGPLYHLTERSERLQALQEAHRILKPGGVLLAAAISRFASALDGLATGALGDPDFVAIVDQDLRTGQHRNAHSDRDYFTTAYLHEPLELKREVEAVGLQPSHLLAIEGPGWLLQNFEQRWQETTWRATLLRLIRSLETEPSLLGVSSHIMIVASK